jgi:hypothetical protein
MLPRSQQPPRQPVAEARRRVALATFRERQLSFGALGIAGHLSTCLKEKIDFVPTLVRSGMHWVRLGYDSTGFVVFVPAHKDLPLLLLEGKIRFPNGPDEERSQVFIFFLIKLRKEAMRNALNVSYTSTRPVVPRVLDVDLFRRTELRHVVHVDRPNVRGKGRPQVGEARLWTSP